jgi:hypothetical protein
MEFLLANTVVCELEQMTDEWSCQECGLRNYELEKPKVHERYHDVVLNGVRTRHGRAVDVVATYEGFQILYAGSGTAESLDQSFAGAASLANEETNYDRATYRSGDINRGLRVLWARTPDTGRPGRIIGLLMVVERQLDAMEISLCDLLLASQGREFSMEATCLSRSLIGIAHITVSRGYRRSGVASALIESVFRAFNCGPRDVAFQKPFTRESSGLVCRFGQRACWQSVLIY